MSPAPEAVSPLLICLVPARNAAEDLPGLLASVALCCDAVVALDDGSTDGTGALLAASPLVRILLANPRRETYHGWDDAANRAQLLEAVSELNPRWLLWLDADERLDPADARALRQFVTSEAQPDSAYGFRVFPLRNDLQHYEDRCLWVYRLFHHAPGQSLERRRLHLFPIPSQIPRSRWRRTTLRIQHLGGLTAVRRQSRFEKYRQADPACEFQTDYQSLLRDPPAALPRWTSRVPHDPILWEAFVATESSHHNSLACSSSEWAISFLVLLPARGLQQTRSAFEGDRPKTTSAGDADGLAQEAFEQEAFEQEGLGQAGLEHEILLVENAFSALPGQPSSQASPHPTKLDTVALHGAAINTQLAKARGEVVCLVAPWLHYSPAGAFQLIVEAHRQGFAMVTGAHRDSDPMGAVLGVPPDLCSWRRDALMEMGGFPPLFSLPCRDFNAALMAAGWQAYAAQGVQMAHSRPEVASNPS